jgi:hypothetical protein
VVGDVVTETPSGGSVGDPFDALIAGLPAEQVSEAAPTDLGLARWADYEVGAGEYSSSTDPNFGPCDYWGATGRAIDGTVDVLAASKLFQNLC